MLHVSLCPRTAISRSLLLFLSLPLSPRGKLQDWPGFSHDFPLRDTPPWPSLCSPGWLRCWKARALGRKAAFRARPPRWAGGQRCRRFSRTTSARRVQRSEDSGAPLVLCWQRASWDHRRSLLDNKIVWLEMIVVPCIFIWQVTNLFSVFQCAYVVSIFVNKQLSFFFFFLILFKYSWFSVLC